MSRKRRRKRSQRGKTRSRPTPATEVVDAEPVTEPEAPERSEADAARRPRGLFAPRTDRGPYPPFGVSLARGFRAAGASPAVLAVAFAYVLGMWALYSVTGRPLAPPVIPILTALPPLHILVDVQEIFGAGLSTLTGFGLAVAVMAIRAVFLALLVLLLLDRLRGRPTDLRGTLRRLPSTALALVMIYAIEFALVQGLPSLFATFGPQFANIGLLIALVGGLMMLVMAPVAAGDGLPAQEALRRGWRAARLPGGRHFGLVLLYFFFYYWLFFNALAAAAFAPATPTIGSWILALAATFIHTGTLGAFVYRWVVVRDEIPAGPAPPRARRGAR